LEELRDRRAALGIEARRGLAQAVRRSVQADRLAGGAEPMPESGFVHRPAASASDEVEHLRTPMRSRRESMGERRHHADHYVGAGLLGAQLDRSVLLQVLPPEPRRIADPQSGEQQHGIGQALARSLGIGGLEGGQGLRR
jgi:hypothetical protein